MRYSKYHNKKVVAGGTVFDSKREAHRWGVLQFLQDRGEISDLQRQVKFVLIPTQREPDTIGPKGGKRPGKTLEREVAYIADFTYRDKDGKLVVEDSKGFRSPEYILKRKLMLWVFGIRISEV